MNLLIEIISYKQFNFFSHIINIILINFRRNFLRLEDVESLKNTLPRSIHPFLNPGGQLFVLKTVF